MSIAAPPSPPIEHAPGVATQPQRVARRSGPDWLPVLGWFVEDRIRHSRINVIPLGNTVDPAERFQTSLKFYRGSEEPVHIFRSEPFYGDLNFRYEGRDLLEAIGQTEFEGLVEITARSLDNGPSHFPWVDSWMEFYSEDDTLNGSVPGFVFKGGTTKRVMSGKWQHWPGVMASDDYSASLLLLNYHPRPVEVRMDLFAPSGRFTHSETLSIAPRMPRMIDLESHVPGLRDLFGREGGIGSLRVWSGYKLPGFVMMTNRHTGLATTFDHTVPYGGPPVD